MLIPSLDGTVTTVTDAQRQNYWLVSEITWGAYSGGNRYRGQVLTHWAPPSPPHSAQAPGIP